DGKLLVSAGGDSAGILWDVATGRQLRRLDGHQGWVRCAAFSPDGRLVFSGGGDRTGRGWEVATGGERLRFEGHRAAVRCGAFSPDGKRLATGSGDTTVLVWGLYGSASDEKAPRRLLTARELDACWAALEETDARKAFRAV